MNFQCVTQELAQAINVVSCCLSPRPTKESYSYIQIEADGDTVSVSATDGIMYMTANVDSQVEIIESGIIALDGKLLAAVVQKQQDHTILLTSNDKSCAIKSGKAKAQLSLRPAEDFPDMPPVSKTGKTAKVTQRDLKACIDYCSFCTSTDQTKKVLTGVLMDFTAGDLHMVGLDGFRSAMRHVKCEYDGEEIKCVVPKSSAVEIARLLDDSETPVSLCMTKEYLHIWVGKFAFSTILLAGEYINVDRLIRNEYKTKALIDSRQFRGSVERAQVMASSGKNDLIFLHFENNTLQITSHSSDGSAADELDIGLQGEPLDIAFNVRYLIDLLKHESDGQIDVECLGKVSPAIIRPLGKSDRLQLVLPVRTL